MLTPKCKDECTRMLLETLLRNTKKKKKKQKQTNKKKKQEATYRYIKEGPIKGSCGQWDNTIIGKKEADSKSYNQTTANLHGDIKDSGLGEGAR